MKKSDFMNSPTGSLTRVEGDVWAFVPNPLSVDQVKYTPALVEALSEADSRLGRLTGVGGQLSNPRLLIRPYMRREAVLSSRIEGTQTTLSELFRAEVEEPGGHGEDADVREVRNYVHAMDVGLRTLPELPLSLRLTKLLHKTLLQGVRGMDRTPGEFRRDQNYIGPDGCRIEDARYVPPPAPQMHAALDAWEKFMHVTDGIPPLVQCAMLHYQFEAIHPFSDGNGRVGRLLITLFLCERGRLKSPLLYLSDYFHEHRGEYYDRLLEVSRSGDWTGWIVFFLKGVAHQSTAAVEQAHKILALRDQYRQRLHELHAPGNTLAALDEVFRRPFVTIPMIAERTKTTYPTAKLIVGRLESAGVLQRLDPEQSWRRIYYADELIRLLEQ